MSDGHSLISRDILRTELQGECMISNCAGNMLSGNSTLNYVVTSEHMLLMQFCKAGEDAGGMAVVAVVAAVNRASSWACVYGMYAHSESTFITADVVLLAADGCSLLPHARIREGVKQSVLSVCPSLSVCQSSEKF